MNEQPTSKKLVETMLLLAEHHEGYVGQVLREAAKLIPTAPEGFPPETPEQARSARRDRYPPRAASEPPVVPDKAEGTDVCRFCYFTLDKCICNAPPPSPSHATEDICDRLGRLECDVLRIHGVDISDQTEDLIRFYREGGDSETKVATP